MCDCPYEMDGLKNHQWESKKIRVHYQKASFSMDP